MTDGTGNVLATYVYAGEHPIMKITPTGVEYLLTDSMNSVIGKADATGASTASIKYDSFGNVTSAVGASAGIDSAIGSEPNHPTDVGFDHREIVADVIGCVPQGSFGRPEPDREILVTETSRLDRPALAAARPGGGPNTYRQRTAADLANPRKTL